MGNTQVPRSLFNNLVNLVILHTEHCQEGLLGNLDSAQLFHPFLTFLLPLQELSFPVTSPP